MRPRFSYLLLCPVFVAAGCSLPAIVSAPKTVATGIASDGGLAAATIDAGQFRLRAYHRGLHRDAARLHVYIEGDGHAWHRRHQLSSDPTPRDPVALRLAAKDKSPSVLYIARPCQYLDESELRDCDPKYWSSHRYSEAVVGAVDETITQLIESTNVSAVALFGYSGGGAIAALLAARRDDAVSLVTVAGNLDHVAWTSHHEVAPLSGSLNPADIATKIAHLPQVHFVGDDDTIMPRAVADSYKAMVPQSNRVTIQTLSAYGHRCCWEEVWPDPLCGHQSLNIPYCE